MEDVAAVVDVSATASRMIAGARVVATAGEQPDAPASLPMARMGGGQPFEGDASRGETREVTHLPPRSLAQPTRLDGGAANGQSPRAIPGGGTSDQDAAGRREEPDGASGEGAGLRPVCTAPQLRRFIKSRAYVPMHELRRRFGIEGGDDDVTVVDVQDRRIFVGLPSPEGELLGDLLRAGDIGYELSFDPVSPIVTGVYPMRPIARG